MDVDGEQPSLDLELVTDTMWVRTWLALSFEYVPFPIRLSACRGQGCYCIDGGVHGGPSSYWAQPTLTVTIY